MQGELVVPAVPWRATQAAVLREDSRHPGGLHAPEAWAQRAGPRPEGFLEFSSPHLPLPLHRRPWCRAPERGFLFSGL